MSAPTDLSTTPRRLTVGKNSRRIFAGALVAQVVIVVTGAAVRLTGSGLGCPTWPECAEGSYVPTPAQDEGLHKWIEFGNRLLTFVLAAIVIAAIIAALRIRPRRRQLILLAIAQFLGIVAQAILGGITVLTDLHPIPVAGHFLLSMVLIAVALTLWFLSHDRLRDGALPREVRFLAHAVVAVTAAVLLLGVVVTGSGPHAGDERARRFGFDPQLVSWLHADLVIVLIGLLIALVVAARLTSTPSNIRIWAQRLLILSLAQGGIGYLQYFTGLPIVLVGAHVLGAALVWVFAWRLHLETRNSAVITR
jgi:heme a synthase